MKPRGKRMFMRSLWDGLEGLRGHQLKLKLLERMADSEAVQGKFWSRVTKGKPNECWEHEPNGAYGYGRWSMISPDRTVSVTLHAHRVSYFLFHRSLPEDVFICHHCDNRLCVNPKHLFVGDNLINIQDMVSKNRQAMGEKQWLHKLTEKEVIWAKQRYVLGGVRMVDIAAQLKISYPALQSALRGKTWKHLPLAV